jgi:hypothetical protein
LACGGLGLPPQAGNLPPEVIDSGMPVTSLIKPRIKETDRSVHSNPYGIRIRARLIKSENRCRAERGKLEKPAPILFPCLKHRDNIEAGHEIESINPDPDLDFFRPRAAHLSRH